jgi:hypothetical protein
MISRILISLIGVAMVAILALGDRPFGLTSSPRIDEIAALPDDPRLAELRRQIQWGDSLYPYVSPKAREKAAASPPKLKFGWTYREWNMLGMPFAAYAESGFAAYLEMRNGVRLALIDDDSRPLIGEVIGRDPTAGYAFPWHRHVWGWLIVLALAVWQLVAMSENRKIRRKAEAKEEAPAAIE